ncbi:hypothetical protein BDD12DRAFT_900487 [Trichophaea hybrida]|nr:hypothetical protein BDD12DRAFT_900487 [Trichophaea hybrida]
MADPSSTRHYDMALRSEKSSATIGNAIRPDISVLCLVDYGESVDPRFVYQALSGYEIKAPGVLARISIIVADDKRAIYFKFKEPAFAGEPVWYAVAATGNDTGTKVGELTPYSGPLGLTVQSELDYSDIYPGKTDQKSPVRKQPQRSGADRKSLRVSGGGDGTYRGNVVIYPMNHPEIPFCAIRAAHLTPSGDLVDSGIVGDRARRTARAFFVSSYALPHLELEIDKADGKSCSRHPLIQASSYMFHDSLFVLT